MIGLNAMGLASYAALAVEFCLLGWLGGVRWIEGGRLVSLVAWCLRFLAGGALIALALLLQALAGVAFSAIGVTLAVAGALALLLRLAAPRIDRPGNEEAVGARERLAWVALGVVLVAAVARAALVPEAGWDAYSHWGLKAKAYFLAGTLVDAGSAHEYYPPLVPLLEAWYYAHRGMASIDEAKVLWSLMGAAFCVALAGHARLAVQRGWLAPLIALGIALLAAPLLESFWTGEADLALTAFLTLGILALFQWHRARPASRRAWLFQACLFGGAAALTKYEGIYRVLVVAAALVAEGLLTHREWRRHGWTAAAVLLASTAALLPWVAFRQIHGVAVTGEHAGALRWDAAAAVLRALLGTFGGVRAGGWVLVLALGAFAVPRQLVTPPLRFLTLVVLAQTLATLGAFFITGSSPEVQVLTSATRLVMQVLPTALFGLGLALACEYDRGAGGGVVEKRSALAVEAPESASV